MTNSPLPFVPSSEERLKTMVALAAVLPGQRVADLGAGDGRVLIALAKEGAEAHGFEIEPKLAAQARANIRKEGLEGKAFVHQKNFFEADLSDFEVLTIYGITSIMRPLEEKLRSELKPGARVISNFFTFPTWEQEEKVGDVYVYRQP
jgi:cyclopropane fatty-acyl-phospholipid synthase-like methyltransferase